MKNATLQQLLKEFPADMEVMIVLRPFHDDSYNVQNVYPESDERYTAGRVVIEVAL